MNVIIVGSGAVGAAICSQLAKEKHDITVIDSNYAAVTDISNYCDVTGLVGNGADLSVLKEAGAERADILIAVTSSDELNILCCYAAKKLGTDHTIARVRNPEYAEFMTLMQKDMNLSLTINPELEAAKEISRILKFPTATKIDSFSDGLVEIAEIKIHEGSPLIGQTLISLREKLKMTFLVCGVKRGDEIHIPSGRFALQEGDIICVTAPDDEINKFFKATGAYKRQIRELIITGAGRTTYYLAELLKKSKMNITVMDSSSERCVDLANDFSALTVINGNVANQDLLLEEGLDKADALLALSAVDEENAIVSMYAKTLGVPKIVTMISSLHYVNFFENVGIESIVSPKSATVGHILRFVRSLAASNSSEINSLHRMLDDNIEALEFIIKENIPGITGIPLKELKKNPDIIIACIVHGDVVVIPTGSDVITPGDRVIVINHAQRMNSIKDIIR